MDHLDKRSASGVCATVIEHQVSAGLDAFLLSFVSSKCVITKARIAPPLSLSLCVGARREPRETERVGAGSALGRPGRERETLPRQRATGAVGRFDTHPQGDQTGSQFRRGRSPPYDHIGVRCNGHRRRAGNLRFPALPITFQSDTSEGYVPLS